LNINNSENTNVFTIALTISGKDSKKQDGSISMINFTVTCAELLIECHQRQNPYLTMSVISTKDLEAWSVFFRGRTGQFLAKTILRLLSVEKVNCVYNNSSSFSGRDFTTRLLKDLGVEYRVGNAQRLKQLPEGSFITISNHPYGGLDGIIMVDMIAGVRPDFKFMVNRYLARVRTLAGNFITVTPADNTKKGITAESIGGLRETLNHIREGHPVGFFPSGAVSDFSLRGMRIRDRNWQEGILRLIRAVNVPVLPVRFLDRNSVFFYFLGLINWRIRTLRLPAEVFNKSGTRPRVVVGKLIAAEELSGFSDADALGVFLRSRVYQMPVPESFTMARQLLNLSESG